MIVVFDLDGTLANMGHRLPLIRGANKNYDAFFRACVDDTVINPVKQIFRALENDGCYIEIWTGRSDMVRGETAEWLFKHDLSPDRLRMRKHGDRTSDYKLKESWLLSEPQKPVLAFEDHMRVVEMWRKHGVQCCQVAPGGF